jgi:hypothetical protein
LSFLAVNFSPVNWASQYIQLHLQAQLYTQQPAKLSAGFSRL